MVMDFDPSTNTFSNATTIYQDPKLYPGWPFFTPDAKWVHVLRVGQRKQLRVLDQPARTESSSEARRWGKCPLVPSKPAPSTTLRVVALPHFVGKEKCDVI